MAKRPVYVAKMETPFYSVDTIEFDKDRGLAKTQKQIKNRTATAKTTQSEKIEKPLPNVEIKTGDLILHRKFGKGKIKVVTDTRLIVDYSSVGQKTLDRAWCEKNCKIIKGEQEMKKRYVYKQDLDPVAEKERVNKLAKLVFRDPKIIEDLDMADLVRLKLFYDQLGNSDILSVLYDQEQVKTRTATQSEKIEKFPPNAEMRSGDLILHRKFGVGKIKTVTDTRLIIDYPSIGQKTLDKAWCEKNCKIIKEEQELLCG